MKNLLFSGLFAFSLQCAAQITGLSVETVVEHNGLAIPELAGYTTYRVYADVTSNTDFISAVYGIQDSPLMLGTDGALFQDPITGNFAQNGVPALFDFFPQMEYDSWVTIGISNSDEGTSVQNTPSTLADAFSAFNAGDGFVVNDPIGGSWCNLLQCNTDLETCAMEDLAFGGSDNRVLLAQLTSTGDVYGVFNMQVFPAGDQDAEMKQTLMFSSNASDVFGCTNPAATGNDEGEGMYNPAATIDDFSCILPCSLSILNVVSPICEGQTGSNTFFAEGSQGGLTWDDDAYEVFVSPSGDLDGTATLDVFDVLTFLKSYGIVCDACEEDINEDGSVSTADLLELWTLFGDEDNESFTMENPNAGQVLVAVDNAGCEYSIETSIDFPELIFDECGICGGEGVPEGDCDCFGNQNDAIGECGGNCETDINANAVCDEEEEGCTTPWSCNYTPEAVLDDGSCYFDNCDSEGIIIPISDEGQITVDCDAGETIYFVDDNSGSTDFQDPYSNNNFTITLCPSEPGDAVQVNFLSFDLQTNANPNNNDVLYAFNGEDTNAELVGAGTGNSFVGVSITASIDNPTGCVTFSLDVNNNATGGDVGWVAEVSCVTPCSYPEAGISLVSPAPFPDNPVSVGVCPDETVTFDASGSIPGAPEFPVDRMIWNWGDGTVETTATSDGFQLGHSYGEPGEYIVTLVVQDVNNCNSTNLLPHQVLVSTIPIFNAEASTPLCEDAPGFLNGNPVQSITWTALPPVGVSELADLPDATGVAFTSELFIDFYDTDQVLEECDDIELITANIEHSFIGDLSFWITCPDGTEVLLMDNGASGGPDPTGCTPEDLGGNNLGIVDVEGFNYSWNMDGEWVLDDSNNPAAANPMPAGTYLPCGDLCDFVGCPLNGIWTFNVIDQWAADNGTLYEWGIDFNPEIVPGVTTFTPVIGLGSDSSYWHPVGDLDNVLTPADLGVVGVSDDANYVDLMFPDPGTFEFGYVVTNNFGCTWDTTLTVEVIDNPGTFITAGVDLEYCGGEIQLQGALDDGSPVVCGNAAGTYNHCYGYGDNSVFSYCPDNPGDGTMMTISFTAGAMEGFGQDFVTVYDGPDATGPVLATLDAVFAGQSFTATNPDGCISFQFTSDYFFCSCTDFCAFEPVEWCVSCGGASSTCGFDWAWEPAEYLVDPNVPQPIMDTFDGEPIEFTLFVEPVGFDNCQATDVMVVEPSFSFEVEQQQPSCFANDGIIGVEVFADAFAEEGPFTIQLYVDDAAGSDLVEELVWDNINDFYYNDLVPGDYTVVVFDGQGCAYFVPISLYPEQLFLEVPEQIQICPGDTATIEVYSPQDSLNAWIFEWDNDLPNGSTQQVSPDTTSIYSVQGIGTNGCVTDSYPVEVSVFGEVEGDLFIEPEFACLDSAELQWIDLYFEFFGGNVGEDEEYEFTVTFQEDEIVTTTDWYYHFVTESSGQFCVAVSDGCEATTSIFCETFVVIDSCYGCTDEEAWNYSPEAEYDDGSCEYFASSCEFIGDSTWQGLELGVYPADGLVHFVADTVFQELVVNAPALVQEPTTGSSFATMSLTNLAFNGMPPGLEFDVVPDTVFASSQECISYSGQPYEPGEYEVELMGDLTVSFFGSPYVIEDFTTPFWIIVEENADPLYGCTYSQASNYSMFAAVDDGSCVFAGCTDPEANNYEKFATEDDGSCDFTPCGLACPTDLDQDGVTNTPDLLLFLGAFGEGCEVEASEWSCGDPLEYQGYDYATVQIGEQCWFAENLRAENYQNGDVIPSTLSDNEWTTTNSGAVAVYGEDNGCNSVSPDFDACNPGLSLEAYGRLYNWFAVTDDRSLCPVNWHVPTDAEWTLLTDFLGDVSVVGDMMKTTYGWIGNGTNSSGFSGLPGGSRHYGSGGFNNAGYGADWWSTTPNGIEAWYRHINQLPEVNRFTWGKRGGFSVRCIQDPE